MTLHPDIERVALLGWRLYPCSTTTKAACFKGATDAATYDLDQLARWSAEYPRCNWRVVMQGSGIWGLDVDAPGADHSADGIAALKALVAENDPLPPRPTTRSGGGGMALFWKDTGHPISGKTGTPSPGIDPRRGRLSITLPPSIHIRTRRPYRWLVAPWETSAPEAPGWLLRAVAPPPEPAMPRRPVIATSDTARRRLARSVDLVLSAPSGAANDTLNRAAYAVARYVAAGAMGESEAVEALYAAARGRLIPHPEARATIASAFRSGFKRPVESRWASP